MKGIYLMHDAYFGLVYGDEERKEIEKMVEIVMPQLDQKRFSSIDPALLKEVEIIICGWGMIPLTVEVLNKLPKLKMVFYGAGSIKGFCTDEMWDKGIRVVSAWAANAVPVAEFTFAQIILSLKNFWKASVNYKLKRGKREFPTPAGAYASTVGLISLGMIGRLVLEKLKTIEVKVIAYDPYISVEEGKKLACEMVSLEELFRRSDVVSCHTPWLKETENMLCGKHFELMKENSTFINTARGAVVNEKEMIDVLKKRPDIYAVLDVTWPEPPDVNSPLYEMENVVLSPHIAGSMGGECRRMGRYIVDEVKRYLNGEKLKYEITREKSKILA